MESKTGLDGGLEAEFFEVPVVVVGVDEGGDGGAELGEVLVSAAVDDLLLEGTVEALDDAVGLRLAEEGEAGDKAVEAGVGLEEVVEVLAAVVMAQLDAAGGLGLAAEHRAEGLGDGFPGGEAAAGFADVPAEAFAVPMNHTLTRLPASIPRTRRASVCIPSCGGCGRCAGRGRSSPGKSNTSGNTFTARWAR